MQDEDKSSDNRTYVSGSTFNKLKKKVKFTESDKAINDIGIDDELNTDLLTVTEHERGTNRSSDTDVQLRVNESYLIDHFEEPLEQDKPGDMVQANIVDMR